MARLLLTLLALPLLSSAFTFDPTVFGGLGGSVVKNVSAGAVGSINPNYNIFGTLGSALGGLVNGVGAPIVNGHNAIDQSVVGGVCAVVKTILAAVNNVFVTAISQGSVIAPAVGAGVSGVGNAVGPLPVGLNVMYSEQLAFAAIKLVTASLTGNPTAIQAATADFVKAIASAAAQLGLGVVTPLGSVTGLGNAGALVGSAAGGTGFFGF